MSFTSVQLHIDIDSIIHSIPEETRSFLLKVVHAHRFVRTCGVYNSHFICLQARTRQKPLNMWATPMRPEPCFPECMLVISNKTLLVITPPFTTTIVIPSLTSHLFGIKLKSGAAAAQESRMSGAVEQGSKCVFPSSLLTPSALSA